MNYTIQAKQNGKWERIGNPSDNQYDTRFQANEDAKSLRKTAEWKDKTLRVVKLPGKYRRNAGLASLPRRAFPMPRKRTKRAIVVRSNATAKRAAKPRLNAKEKATLRRGTAADREAERLERKAAAKRKEAAKIKTETEEAAAKRREAERRAKDTAASARLADRKMRAAKRKAEKARR